MPQAIDTAAGSASAAFFVQQGVDAEDGPVSVLAAVSADTLGALDGIDAAAIGVSVPGDSPATVHGTSVFVASSAEPEIARFDLGADEAPSSPAAVRRSDDAHPRVLGGSRLRARPLPNVAQRAVGGVGGSSSAGVSLRGVRRVRILCEHGADFYESYFNAQLDANDPRLRETRYRRLGR